MIAKIGFTIYKDYNQHLTEDNDYDYSVALDVLNKELKELLYKDELVFTYAGKQVEIVLPVDMRDTGNIFSEDDYDGPCWDGVDITCEIDCDPYDFDSSKLIVEKCPYYFDTKCILH